MKKEIIKKILKEILENSFPTSQYTKKSPGEIYEDIEKEMTEYSTKIKFSLNKSKKEIYECMVLENKINIHISTFYKLIPNNIIKSKKKTDMCNICNLKDKLLAKEKQCIDNGVELSNKLIEDLRAINQHKEFYTHQNSQYKKDIDNIDDKTCVIVLDYKENIKVGGGPIETNSCFYEKTSISLLGFALVFKEANIIKYEYHNFLSEILSHDSLFSGECFLKILKDKRFKRIKHLKIWSDNGNHFRSLEFLYYLFKEAPKYFSGSIKYNRFVECHGKSIVDGHFGVLSKLIKQKELELYISDIKDLKEMFEREEKRKGLYFSAINKSTISQKTFFYIYERKNRPKKRSLKVDGLYINLSFLFINGVLFSSPLSFDDVSNYSRVPFGEVSCDDNRETRRAINKTCTVSEGIHEVGRITRGYISNRVVSLTKMTSFYSNTN